MAKDLGMQIPWPLQLAPAYLHVPWGGPTYKTLKVWRRIVGRCSRSIYCIYIYIYMYINHDWWILDGEWRRYVQIVHLWKNLEQWNFNWNHWQVNDGEQRGAIRFTLYRPPRPLQLPKRNMIEAEPRGVIGKHPNVRLVSMNHRWSLPKILQLDPTWHHNTNEFHVCQSQAATCLPKNAIANLG